MPGSECKPSGTCARPAAPAAGTTTPDNVPPARLARRDLKLNLDDSSDGVPGTYVVTYARPASRPALTALRMATGVTARPMQPFWQSGGGGGLGGGAASPGPGCGGPRLRRTRGGCPPRPGGPGGGGGGPEACGGRGPRRLFWPSETSHVTAVPGVRGVPYLTRNRFGLEGVRRNREGVPPSWTESYLTESSGLGLRNRFGLEGVRRNREAVPPSGLGLRLPPSLRPERGGE